MTVDGRRRYLMPGLSDMHAPLNWTFTDAPGASPDANLQLTLLSYLATGVTLVRDTCSEARLPGLACPSDVWRPMAGMLAARYRSHLVEIGGFAGAPAGANAGSAVVSPVAAEIARYLRKPSLSAPR